MLHLACSTDDRLAADCAVMLASLVAHNPGQSLQVHLLHDSSLPAADVEALGDLVRGGGAGFDPINVSADQGSAWPDSDRFPANAWYRVRLPELLPEVSRVLYLDADALIVGSLQELWAADLDGSPLGAITQYLYPRMVPRVTGELQLSASDYFNSGVLLFDLARWRAESLTEAIAEYVRGHISLLAWPDQDALNGVLQARRHALHPRWNAMTGLWELPARQLPYSAAELREARVDPAIVHFIGPYKPWHYRCKSRYRAEWWRYLEGTPWRYRAVEGRSLKDALLRPLPTVWAYNVESAYSTVRARIAHRGA